MQRKYSNTFSSVTLVIFASLFAPAALVAQFPTTAPAPAPIKTALFPPFQEATLANGLHLLVVHNDKQPVVAVSLSFPAGSAYDPAGKSGLADMLAGLLTKGAGKRSAEEISAAIEGVGGSIGAGSSSDFLTLHSEVLANNAKLAFDLIADAAIRPTLPEKELELLRKQTLSALQLEQGQPASIASHAFLRGLFGDQPYGRKADPKSVGAITHDDLVAFQKARLRPSGALLVVAGSLSFPQAQALAQAAFAGWTGTAPTVAPAKPLVQRSAMEIVLVHRPGSVQSNIVVGNLTWPPTDPRSYAARVANKILGGGANARLFMILREQKSWTYGAYSNLSSNKYAGYFQATSEVRTEVTDSALVEMLVQLKRIGAEAVPTLEFDQAKNAMTGTFPLSIETAGQVAAQVANAKLLGLPADYVQTYRKKLSAVTASQMQAAAKAAIRPGQALIVVVGDGAKIYDKLLAIGPVRIVSPDGTPLTASELTVKAASLDLDLSKLKAATDSFTIFVQGNPFGYQTSKLDKSTNGWTYAEHTSIATFVQLNTVVTFSDAMVPLRATQSGKQGPMDVKIDVTYADGRAKGSATAPQPNGTAKEVIVDAAVPPGTIDDNMISVIMPTLKWKSGASFKIAIFQSSKNAVSVATVSVTGEESVKVPAGTFDAWKVDIAGLDAPITVWIEKAGDHRMLKQVLVGTPVEIQRVK